MTNFKEANFEIKLVQINGDVNVGMHMKAENFTV